MDDHEVSSRAPIQGVGGHPGRMQYGGEVPGRDAARSEQIAWEGTHMYYICARQGATLWECFQPAYSTCTERQIKDDWG